MLALTLALPFAASAEPTGLLRTDGVPVKLMEPGALEVELALHSRNAAPFERFSDEFVKHALATGIDWRTKGAVTPAKDQGAHGYAQCPEPAGAAGPLPPRSDCFATSCPTSCSVAGARRSDAPTSVLRLISACACPVTVGHSAAPARLRASTPSTQVTACATSPRSSSSRT